MAIASRRNEKTGERMFAPRFFILPAVLAALFAAGFAGLSLDSQGATIAATALILICGIPHGALDIEVAMTRFGKSSHQDKMRMILFYLIGAVAMSLCWWVSAPIALILFLVISIIHFGSDWQDGVDPFLGVMIGWAIISAPAFFKAEQVDVLFAMLTSTGDEGTVAGMLAATAVPALLGSLVFLALAVSRADYGVAVQVATCLIAAIFLPPLVGFALYFCLLHSPRHLADAFRGSGLMSSKNKVITCLAVTLLSFGLGVIVYQWLGAGDTGPRLLRTGFILLSVLTVPHFALEIIMSAKKASRVEAH